MSKPCVRKYFYSQKDVESSCKRRKLSDGAYVAILGDRMNQYAHAHVISSLPVQTLTAENPQDLTYSILMSDKVYYTKQEVLEIISRYGQMVAPKFEGECEYIV